MQKEFLLKGIYTHKYIHLDGRTRCSGSRRAPFILWDSCPRASLQSGLRPAPVGIQIGLCVSSSLMDLSLWGCYISGAKWRF